MKDEVRVQVGDSTQKVLHCALGLCQRHAPARVNQAGELVLAVLEHQKHAIGAGADRDFQKRDDVGM